MPTWGELLKELKTLQESHADRPLEFGGTSPHDVLRRKYLRDLSNLTGRATIVYATSWLEAKDANPNQLQIGLGDVQGFMEAVANVEERELDLLLHSPGGNADAAESVVEYLRSRFDHIRVFVPVAAMSAATMVALAADEIVMGAHSQLGPIDPQFTILTPEGPRSSPAQAIKDQFEMARVQCEANPKSVAVWLPILRSYGPGLLAQCDHQRTLAEQLVGNWLSRYMLANEDDPATKARDAAKWFADFTYFRSHGRRVSRDDARAQGLKVVDLEADDALQDSVLSVHHAVMHTMSGTPAVKLIENQHGRAYIQMVQAVFAQLARPGEPPTDQGPPPQPQVRPRSSRTEPGPRSRKRKRK